MSAFRWKSLLGVSVIVFLLYGAFNVFLSLQVPIKLVTGGVGMNNLVLSTTTDTYMLGGKQAVDALRQTNPKLDTLLVSSMLAMCSQMMAFAIVSLLVTWFVIRQGQAWGVWAVTAAVLIQIPYYAVIINMYAAQGAPVGGVLPILAVFNIVPLVAFALGLVGIRRLKIA